MYINLLIYYKMRNDLMTGIEFNKLYRHQTFIKLTNENDYSDTPFKTGLNIDTDNFDPSNEWSPNGYSFHDIHDISREILLDYVPANDYRIVTIPNDALVYVKTEDDLYASPEYFMADKILLSDKIGIWDDEKLCEEIVTYNPSTLQYVINQTDKICKIAVEKDPNILKYVKNQTNELCNLAVKNNGTSLYYVKVQTNELCNLAIKNDSFAIYFVNNPTNDMYKNVSCTMRTSCKIFNGLLNCFRYVKN
jgi:hypothetical protein